MLFLGGKSFGSGLKSGPQGGCFLLAPGKCAFFSPKSRLSQVQAMTKARQLSPEGGEKCGFFLRGGHANAPSSRKSTA